MEESSGDNTVEPPRQLDVDYIAPRGDLFLEVQDERSDEICKYRVDIAVLRQKSRYFDRLLDPAKFAEGRDVHKTLDSLNLGDTASRRVALDDLPKIRVLNVGRTSKVNSIRRLCADFLTVLHGGRLSPESLPLANLANLTVVADRFDALDALAEYAQRHKCMQAIDGKLKSKSAALPEESLRRRIMIGHLLKHSSWVTVYSKQLICQNSIRWTQDNSVDTQSALWWDLPGGLEEELLTRREYALDTIESICTHFLQIYTSNERQCKLGYDSSLQCDAYQLGEMVRFFMRGKLIDWKGTLLSKEVDNIYTSNLEALLETLRKCPSYQIDRNHTHCGLRSRLLPVLDHIEPYVTPNTRVSEIGICGDCWSQHKPMYSWTEAKQPVSWSKDSNQRQVLATKIGVGQNRCLEAHLRVRNMFMAVGRDWTGPEAERETYKGAFTLNMRMI